MGSRCSKCADAGVTDTDRRETPNLRTKTRTGRNHELTCAVRSEDRHLSRAFHIYRKKSSSFWRESHRVASPCHREFAQNDVDSGISESNPAKSSSLIYNVVPRFAPRVYGDSSFSEQILMVKFADYHTHAHTKLTTRVRDDTIFYGDFKSDQRIPTVITLNRYHAAKQRGHKNRSHYCNKILKTRSASACP